MVLSLCESQIGGGARQLYSVHNIYSTQERLTPGTIPSLSIGDLFLYEEVSI